jgi:hypothetical protein
LLFDLRIEIKKIKIAKSKKITPNILEFIVNAVVRAQTEEFVKLGLLRKVINEYKFINAKDKKTISLLL